MKILIIGEFRIGKSTLGSKLSEILGVNVFNITNIVYDMETKRIRKTEERVKLLNKINFENGEWIIEGDLPKDLDFLLNLSSEVILLDFRKNTKAFFKKLFKSNLELYPEVKKRKLYESLGRYSSKLIIVNCKRDIKKLLAAYQENFKG